MIQNQDQDILQLQAQFEKDVEESFQGKIPYIKVIIPDFLTKVRVLEIHRKIVLSIFIHIKRNIWSRLLFFGKSEVKPN